MPTRSGKRPAVEQFTRSSFVGRATGALPPLASNPTQPISSNIVNGKRVSLPVRKGLAYLQTVADSSRQFGSPYPLLSLPANCLLLSGVETSLAAASSRDRGAQRWGPKSSPRGEEGCSLAGESFLCVSLPYDVLRRLLRGNLRYTAKASSSTDSFCARARRGHEPSAGFTGIPSVHGEKPGAAFLLHVWQVSVRSHQ